MKVGIYGGTFDPPHLGHLNLAAALMEAHELDEIWFCPAHLSPLKTQMPATDLDRLKMLEIAIRSFPQFSIIDWELKRKGRSYTLDTVLETKKYPHQFYLLMGDKSAEEFHKWHKPEEIVENISILIGSRMPYPPRALHGSKVISDAITKGWTQIPMFDLCSTEVRQRVQNQRSIQHLVPEKIIDYIKTHKLYL
ncbi:MAG: nicotinate (nicotinamide) nucleotide adenylyltransferase [Waddliaceae bacterium]